jgi:shikimate dehydrogenase
VIGIIGDPVEHSLSPIMHNALFSRLNLDFIYVAFHVTPDKLEKAVEGVRALNIAGINVTIPHKTEIIPHLDEVSAEAQIIGAVNTVVNRSGRLIGFNTDGYGFEKAVSTYGGLSLKGKKIFLIGAGGAARAVAGRSLLSGANSVIITNRTWEKAEALVEDLKESFRKISSTSNAKDAAGEPRDLKCVSGIKDLNLKVIPWQKESWKQSIAAADVIVNTTSIGMNGKGNLASLIPWESVKDDAVFFDAVYAPVQTDFLIEAGRRGYKTVYGIYMLIYQGAGAFKIWTGRQPDIKVMKQVLESYLAGKGDSDVKRTGE